MSPRKVIPGRFETFNGLWKRGSVDDCPPDHFSDSGNLCFKEGFQSRDGLIPYLPNTDIVRMRLYKPNPPFVGTNVPRILALTSDGNLRDLLLGTILTGNSLFKDFSLVNFFGRGYISFSDGKVGIENQYLNVYNGITLSTAGGNSPGVGITAVAGAPGSGVLQVGTYLISYAFETATGFITQPAAPFVAIDSFGSYSINITNLPLGPAGTAARWIIASQAIPLRTDLGVPFDVGSAQFYPLFLAVRIPNNTAVTYNPYSVYDETLVDSADFLFTRLTIIPCGVGLLDYNGRLVSYGEFSDPSIVRVSEIGEPESFSSTSGFFITDPTDSTGVRSATQYHGLLYVYKRERGYVTQDNQDEASTWKVDNFEKSKGAEQYGIADILDAKGSSSDGYVIASLNGIHYFNGVFQEPELSYKIRDLWERVNKVFFHKIQLVQDPINQRIYCLVPLDVSQDVNAIIYGDYRNGLDPQRIKWDLWTFANNPTSLLVYGDFTSNVPSTVTRISDLTRVSTLNVNKTEMANDNGIAINSFAEFASIRYGDGISEFNEVIIKAVGPCVLGITLYGLDKTESYNAPNLVITSGGKEYVALLNLSSEEGILRISHNDANKSFKVLKAILIGSELWATRVR